MGLWAAAGLGTFVRHPLNDQHPRSTHYNIAISHLNRAISGSRREVDDTMGRVLGKSIFLHLGYSARGSVPHPSFFFLTTPTLFSWYLVSSGQRGQKWEIYDQNIGRSRFIECFFSRAFQGEFQEGKTKLLSKLAFFAKLLFFKFYFLDVVPNALTSLRKAVLS